MIDRLDLLLEDLREPEPSDEAFVQLVMHEVRADEVKRRGRRAMRRPFVVGIAAAAVVCGGAVAAVVGTNPSPTTEEPAPKSTARVTVTDAPRPSTPVVDSDAPKSSAPQVRTPGATVPASQGRLTDHTAFVVDKETGLRLQTETYSTAFNVDEPQRITLTLSNTGRYPISITGPRGCNLQVMAVPAGEEPARLDPSAYGGRFAWSCAGSPEDPRVQAADETYVLRPGETRTADGSIKLTQPGEWDVMGICRCSYSQVRPTPVPKDNDPLGDLTQRALPSPLLPESTDGENLTTPALRVRAS